MLLLRLSLVFCRVNSFRPEFTHTSFFLRFIGNIRALQSIYRSAIVFRRITSSKKESTPSVQIPGYLPPPKGIAKLQKKEAAGHPVLSICCSLALARFISFFLSCCITRYMASQQRFRDNYSKLSILSIFYNNYIYIPQLLPYFYALYK